MKSKLSQLTQRMLLVCALCPMPLVAMATSVVADESFESVAHSRPTLMTAAGQAGRAGDKFSFGAAPIAERGAPQSFAHAAREHLPSPLAGGKAFSHSGVLNGNVSLFSSLSESSSQSAIAAIATPVPEPGTYTLMLAGLAGLGFIVMRRRGRS